MVAVLQLRLSGGQNNQDPKGSIGGNRSDTSVTTDVLENLFDNISRNEAQTGRTEFRCFYVWNNSGTPATGTIIEVKVNPGVTNIAVGLEPAGKGDGRTTGVAQTLVTEDEVPTGVTFFEEESTNDWDTVKLPLGFIQVGECVPVWLKRESEKGEEQEISLTIDIVHDGVTLPAEDYDDGAAIGEFFKAKTTLAGQFQIGQARIGFSDIG